MESLIFKDIQIWVVTSLCNVLEQWNGMIALDLHDRIFKNELWFLAYYIPNSYFNCKMNDIIVRIATYAKIKFYHISGIQIKILVL